MDESVSRTHPWVHMGLSLAMGFVGESEAGRGGNRLGRDLLLAAAWRIVNVAVGFDPQLRSAGRWATRFRWP
jgi:hypothetical protein